MDKHDRAILLKIKRQFTKDESIAFLNQTISKLEQQIGMLKSEKEELLFTLQQVKKPTDFSKTIRRLEETVYKVSKENERLKLKTNG